MAGDLTDTSVPALGSTPAAAVAVLALVTVVGLLLVGVLVVRRLVIGQLRGTFECHVRSERPGMPEVFFRWRPGVARYEAARVVFFAALALTWWPSATFDRERLSLVDRRPATPRDSLSGSVRSAVVRCRYDGRLVELAMDEHAAGGFAVWVESGPPGRGVNVA